MDHNANAIDSITKGDVQKVLDHHCFTGGDKSFSEVFGVKAHMTPAQYREVFDKAAKDSAMVMFPVIAITEYVATKLAEHGAEVLAKQKK